MVRPGPSIRNDARPRHPSAAEITDGLRLFVPEGQATEIRILKAGRAGTVSGYFDDLELAAQAALSWNGKAPGIYFLPNPIDPALLARANNRLRERAERTTRDDDIPRRRWLLADFDPVRPAGISSTDAEHRAAIDRAVRCRDWLSSDGWPSPILADSGNGAHLCYSIDLPNDPASAELVQRCLQALDLQHSDAAVTVDRTTYNAARIWKLYGTLACKGDPTADRPHRVAKILETLDRRVKVPVDLLEALAAKVPPEEPAPHASGAHSNGRANGWDLEGWIAEHNLPVVSRGTWNGGKKFILNPCPWNAEHTNRSAYVVQFASGAIAAGCHHNGCAGNGWHALRDVYEPGWREQKRATKSEEATAGDQARSRHGGTGSTSSGKPKPLRTRCFCNIEQAPLRWLWPGWLPRDTVTLLAGYEGVGKSTLCVDWATRLSTGTLMPGQPDDAQALTGKTLFLSAEDAAEIAMRGRLEAAGANLASVDTLVADEDLYLPSGVGNLQAAIEEGGYLLVVLDTLDCFLDEHVNTISSAPMRRIFKALTRVAWKTGCAIVALQHPNKGKNVGTDKISGNRAYTGACRSVLVAGAVPDEPEQRVLAVLKGNYCGKIELPAIAYSLENSGDFARTGWGEASSVTARQLLGETSAARKAPKRDEAIRFLVSFLSAGKKSSKEVYEAAAKLELNHNTVDGAARHLGIDRSERDGFPAVAFWRLPAAPPRL
jgi:hypothetical protein